LPVRRLSTADQFKATSATVAHTWLPVLVHCPSADSPFSPSQTFAYQQSPQTNAIPKAMPIDHRHNGAAVKSELSLLQKIKDENSRLSVDAIRVKNKSKLLFEAQIN
jgi:hypothetical protein